MEGAKPTGTVKFESFRPRKSYSSLAVQLGVTAGRSRVTCGRVAFVRNLVLLVLRGLGEVSVDRLFAQCLACFEPMQTFHEDEAITIRPNQDGHLLSDFQHTLGDFLNNLGFERCAAFYRHVDVRDRKFFSPHHWASPKECHQHATKGNNLSLRDVSVLPETLEPIRRAPSAFPRSSEWQASGQAPGNVRKVQK